MDFSPAREVLVEKTLSNDDEQKVERNSRYSLYLPMLPKKRRVNVVQVSTLMQQGTPHHSAHISLRIQKDTAHVSRFSAVVSKKVASSAVERNKLKRKLYKGIGEYISSLPTGWKGVFFAKKGFSDLTLISIKQEVKVLLEKSLNISLS